MYKLTSLICSPRLWGEICVKITPHHLQIRVSFIYAHFCYFGVCTFHLGIHFLFGCALSFGYATFWGYALSIWVYIHFLLGYVLFIWVYTFYLGMQFLGGHAIF